MGCLQHAPRINHLGREGDRGHSTQYTVQSQLPTEAVSEKNKLAFLPSATLMETKIAKYLPSSVFLQIYVAC